MTYEESTRKRRGAGSGRSGKNAVAISIALIGVVLLAGAGFWLFHRGSSRSGWADGAPVGTTSGTSHAGSSAAKPSPYEQRQNQRPASSPVVAPQPALPSANAADPANPETQPAEAGPVVGPPPVFPPMTVPAIHQKAFGRSCSGHLTLTATYLRFECRPSDGRASDPGRNVDVSAEEVKSADRNGVVLRDGQRYHFTVSSSPGVVMSDTETRAFFQNWVNRIDGRR